MGKKKGSDHFRDILNPYGEKSNCGKIGRRRRLSKLNVFFFFFHNSVGDYKPQRGWDDGSISAQHFELSLSLRDIWYISALIYLASSSCSLFGHHCSSSPFRGLTVPLGLLYFSTKIAIWGFFSDKSIYHIIVGSFIPHLFPFISHEIPISKGLNQWNHRQSPSWAVECLNQEAFARAPSICRLRTMLIARCMAECSCGALRLRTGANAERLGLRGWDIPGSY